MNNNTHTAGRIADHFSLKRMMAYLRFYCRMEGRTLLYAVGTIFTIIAVIIFISVITHLSVYRYGYEQLRQMPGFDPMWSAECNCAMFLLLLLAPVAGSMIYGRFSTKSSRIEVLTIPATGTEKLASWMIIYIAGAFVAWFVCLMCVDILRVLLMHILTPYGSQVHVINPSRLLTFNEFVSTEGALRTTKWIVDIYGIALFLEALFAVGSIYLPRYSFVKTSCALMLLNSVIALLLIAGQHLFFGNSPVMSTLHELGPGEMTFSRIVWSGIIWVVVAGLLYWLSYARMKQTEVALKW